MQTPNGSAAIVAARKREGLTQFQLAVKASLHPATVSLAERGARISKETAKKLSDALGVPVEQLQ